MADNSQKSSKEQMEKASINNPIVRNNLPRFLSDGATRLDQFGNAINQGIAQKPYTANVLQNHPVVENDSKDKLIIKASTISSVDKVKQQIHNTKTKNTSKSHSSKPKSPSLGR